jgi:DinB superfamily
MLSTLNDRLKRMERHRGALLARIAPLGAEQLVTRPSPERWHVLDILEHVIVIEEMVLRGFATRPGPLPLLARVQGGLQLRALMLYLRAGGKIQAPSRAILPRGNITLAELRERWDRTRAGYRTALEAFDRGDLVRPMMKHPIVGKLTPAQTLTFLDAHLAHHGRQVERLQRAFPPRPAPNP